MSESLGERMDKLRKKSPWDLRKPGQKRVVKEEAEELQLYWDAMDLRRAGASYRQIARVQGCSESTARDRVQWAMNQIIEEPARELRDLEIQRLDDMQRIYWAKMSKDSDPATGQLILKIIQERARLLGIDKPLDQTPYYLLAQAEHIAAAIGIDPHELLRMAEWFTQQGYNALPDAMEDDTLIIDASVNPDTQSSESV